MSNPDLARHSTELFMDSGFSPLSQRMGAMVAFDRFEDFRRWGCRTTATAVVREQKGVEEPKLAVAGSARGSSCSSRSPRLGLSCIFSTTVTWWGHDKSFGDTWSLEGAHLAQVKHLWH